VKSNPRRIDWVNTLFLIAAHLAAIGAVCYLVLVRCDGWTVALGLGMFACCGISITGGYHRLFSHPTYRCRWGLRLFYLLFGAASAQNSALRWSADHREHHRRTDEEEDPYNIKRGFWWAHMGWVFFKGAELDPRVVRDLTADPLIRFQDRYYVPLALAVGLLFPMGIAFLWGDVVGAVLVAGFLRLVLQYHATFAVNSVAHTIGTKSFVPSDSSRDHLLTALLTLGEGYHNFHHRFPSDYRNGYRAYHFDPTKWFVRTMSWIGVTWDLKRTPDRMIEQARSG
jgi:stearoyl-CoA desaturase (delta-9 desaturase)